MMPSSPALPKHRNLLDKNIELILLFKIFTFEK